MSATFSWPMNDADAAAWPPPPPPPRMTWTKSAAISRSRMASSTDWSASPTCCSASAVGDVEGPPPGGCLIGLVRLECEISEWGGRILLDKGSPIPPCVHTFAAPFNVGAHAPARAAAPV